MRRVSVRGRAGSQEDDVRQPAFTRILAWVRCAGWRRTSGSPTGTTAGGGPWAEAPREIGRGISEEIRHVSALGVWL